MRGFVEKTANNTLLLTVKYHSICEVSRKERNGFEMIKVPDISTGEEITKYVKRYDTIEAMVTNIEWRDTKQQYDTRFQSWRIHLRNADGDRAVLEIPFKTNACDRLMKLAENIDFSKPVEFRAWCDSSGKKDKTAFYVGQRENDADEKSVTVPQKYTRANMGNCPEAVQGIDGWSYSAQLQYLHGQMMNVVIPRVQAAAAMANERPDNDDGEPFVGDESDDDTAPF